MADGLLSTDLDWLRARGPYPCNGGCGAKIDWPFGICESCEKVQAEALKRVQDQNRADLRNCIPELFRWAKFGDPRLPERCGAEQVRRANQALRGLLTKRYSAAILTGPAGGGKTSIACAMLDAAMDQGFVPASFFDAFAISRAYRDSKLGATPPTIAAACEAKLLVIDDLGSEQTGSDAIAEVIFARHAAMRPTIVTTWKPQPDIAAKYGDGCARRLYERAALLAFGGVSRA